MPILAELIAADFPDYINSVAMSGDDGGGWDWRVNRMGYQQGIRQELGIGKALTTFDNENRANYLSGSQSYITSA